MARRIGDQQPDRTPRPHQRMAADGEPVPRRVRHLIVLPGGNEEREPEVEAEVGPEWEAEATPELLPVPAIPLPLLAGPVPAQAAAAAVAAPVQIPAHPSLRLRLRVISRSVTAPKAPTMPFIILASVLVSLAVLGLVVLRVMVDQASFRVDDLSNRVAQQQSSLTELDYTVSVADAPGAIANRAAALGMVPATRIQPLPPPIAPAPAGGSAGTAAGSR